MDPMHSSKILDGMSDAFMAMDLDLVVTFFNTEAERLLGRSREEVLGKPLFDSFPEARGSIFEEKYRKAAKERCTLAFDTYFDVDPYANWYSVKVSPTEDGICVFFHTQGELIQLEKALRKITACLLTLGNEYQSNVDSLVELVAEIMEADFSAYRALKGTSLSIVGSWNLPEELHSVEAENAGLCPELLLRSDESYLLIDNLPDSKYAGSDPAANKLGLKTYLGHVIKTGDMRIGVLCVCYRRKVSLSEDRLELMKIIAAALGNVEMRREKEQLLVNSNKLLEDALAHLKKAQNDVIRHERMSALGQMVSGIAHDFNNALMPILGISDLLLENPELMDDTLQVTKDLEMIRNSAATAANTVKSLREFYRPTSDIDLETVELPEVIRNAVKRTEDAWKVRAMEEERPIEMQVITGPIPSTVGNKSALEAVISNLVLNAVDAMPRGGTITVRAWHEEGYIYISVTDNGEGMPEEVRAHCLEPFFTTKYSSGTGMGLSRSYGIISRHGGSMTVESTLGKGTEVVIKLIRRIPEEPPPEQEPEKATEDHPRALDILVVDDDERTRYLLKKMLTNHATTVTLCSGGEEALSEFKSRTPALVITDKAMPEMDGIELSQKIKAHSPDTPVIMLTGYGDIMDPDKLPPSIDVLLGKPLTRQQLYEAIETAMADR